jgi:hypothetical protein
MVSRRSIGALLAVTVAAAAAGHVAAFQRISKADGDRFQAKLTRIVLFGNTQAAPGRKATQTTELTDDELNSYLRFHARDQIPTGIVDPTLNALGDGRVGGRVTVDLDAVRAQKQRGWLDPMAYLTGKLPVTATGTLTTKDGVGRFQLESAEVSGITVPKSLIQELLTHYSRTPEQPQGINMDDPFELPSNIKEIRVGKAQSTVVQ